MLFRSYLPWVENHSWSITDEEDNDNDDEHPGNSLIPPLPLAGPHIGAGRVADDLEGETIEDDQEEEGDESHHDKVGNKEIVSAVAVAISKFGGTNLRQSAFILKI